MHDCACDGVCAGGGYDIITHSLTESARAHARVCALKVRITHTTTRGGSDARRAGGRGGAGQRTARSSAYGKTGGTGGCVCEH